MLSITHKIIVAFFLVLYILNFVELFNSIGLIGFIFVSLIWLGAIGASIYGFIQDYQNKEEK